MFTHQVLASSPFYQAYLEADFLGKLIFLALIGLSICSWVIIVQKWWIVSLAKKNSSHFRSAFEGQQLHPLNVTYKNKGVRSLPNPFLELYLAMKKQAVEILHKNRSAGEESEKAPSYLSLSDVEMVYSHLQSNVAKQIKELDRQLFLLSTAVTLAPFLGLLGTVWGISLSLSHLQGAAASASNQMVLAGLSLALCTTVLGLLIAIPALLGYNFLKNSIHSFQTEMEGFATEIVQRLEMQYRIVDL